MADYGDGDLSDGLDEFEASNDERTAKKKVRKIAAFTLNNQN